MPFKSLLCKLKNEKKKTNHHQDSVSSWQMKKVKYVHLLVHLSLLAH